MLYVLRISDISNQFVDILHTREIEELVGVSKRCLFARVVYNVFPLLSDLQSSRRLT